MPPRHHFPVKQDKIDWNALELRKNGPPWRNSELNFVQQDLNI